MRIHLLFLLLLAIAITMTSSAKLVEICTYYSDSNKPASGALVYVDERFAGATSDDGNLSVDMDLGSHSVEAQCTLGKHRYKGETEVNVTNDPMGTQWIWLGDKKATRPPLCPHCSE